MTVRAALLGSVALMGLAIGALFAYSQRPREEFAAIEINGVSLVAEVAADRLSLARGLSGRDAIADNEAMLFIFGRPGRHAIWMKEMRFPIDIFWIKNGLITDIEAEVPPPALGAGDASLPVYRPDTDAELVLETAAGFAKKHGITIGDRIRISGDAARGIHMEEEENNPAQTPPGEEFTIDALRQRPAVGNALRVGEAMSGATAYRKFPITYVSGGLTLTGVMNVPEGPVPEGGFPVIILNHGLIDARIYASGRGSRREQDFFARNGYVTIHPDYRGYASSTAPAAAAADDGAAGSAAAITWPWYGASPSFPAHHDFYVGYTSDVMALVAAITASESPLMDAGRIGMWGHSMGGGIAARVAVLSPDVRAYVLFGSISADAEENFYELPADEVRYLRATYGAEGADIYRRVSPITYFADVRAPVQLHHGAEDRDVPVAFSERMYETLARHDKKAELYTYPGEPHEFADAWPLAASRALQFFDRYVKSAR